MRISLLGKGIEPDPRDAECKSVHFTPGEARHMAAILGYLADESEQTNVPNSSQQRCLGGAGQRGAAAHRHRMGLDPAAG